MGRQVAKGQKTITRVDDGYTIRLAPQAIVIPANSDGSNPVLTSAKTRVFLEKGGLSVALTITSVVGTGCTATFSANEVAITAVSALQGDVRINFTGADGYVSNVQINFVISKQGQGGEAGITVLLDNETHALPASFDGTVTASALDTARTKIMVFKGSTQLTAVAANATPNAGQFRYNVDTVTGGTAVRIDNSNVRLSAITADQAVINLNIYAENLTAVYTKQMTITKVREGKEGQKGAKGALPMFRGVYNTDDFGNTGIMTYYGTAERSDIVLYNGTAYFAKEDAGVFNNIAPTDPAQTKWAAFGSQVSSIATGLLLAVEAYIDKLIVRNIRTRGMFGQPVVVGDPASGDTDKRSWFELTSSDNQYNKNTFRFAVDSRTINPAWGNMTGDDKSLNLMEANDQMGGYYDNGKYRPLAGMRFTKYFENVYGNPDEVKITGNGVFSSASGVEMFIGGVDIFAAVMGFLRRRETTVSNYINAGIVGIQNVSGDNCYAGYFQGAVRIDGQLISSQGGSSFNGDTVPVDCRYYQVYHDNIYLPNNPRSGHTVIVRNNSRGSKTLRTQGSSIIYFGDSISSNGSSYLMARNMKLELVYDGTNWVVY